MGPEAGAVAVHRRRKNVRRTRSWPEVEVFGLDLSSGSRVRRLRVWLVGWGPWRGALVRASCTSDSAFCAGVAAGGNRSARLDRIAAFSRRKPVRIGVFVEAPAIVLLALLLFAIEGGRHLQDFGWLRAGALAVVHGHALYGPPEPRLLVLNNQFAVRFCGALGFVPWLVAGLPAVRAALSEGQVPVLQHAPPGRGTPGGATGSPALARSTPARPFEAHGGAPGHG